jgi:hypothetical protein
MKEFDMICDLCSIVTHCAFITPHLITYKENVKEEKYDVFDLCEECEKLLAEWKGCK